MEVRWPATEAENFKFNLIYLKFYNKVFCQIVKTMLLNKSLNTNTHSLNTQILFSSPGPRPRLHDPHRAGLVPQLRHHSSLSLRDQTARHPRSILRLRRHGGWQCCTRLLHRARDKGTVKPGDPGSLFETDEKMKGFG